MCVTDEKAVIVSEFNPVGLFDPVSWRKRR